MHKCLDCGEEMEIDPSDYDIDDMLYCEHCGAVHLVTSIEDEDMGIAYELMEEEK
ncbi:MAG: hypothetical protein Q8P68_03870 [Candidatus Peregrinibacteria bacterium]|nr:hypothetical protein [Candidatus Peregrinibacteria bacterium]MDZ4245437.1 hypothetical protein [Candidatus Gracilibacteria bacterium]